MRWGENGGASQTLVSDRWCGWMGGWHLALSFLFRYWRSSCWLRSLWTWCCWELRDLLSMALIFCVGKKSVIFCRHVWNSVVGNFCICLIKRFSWQEKFGLTEVYKYNIQLIIKNTSKKQCFYSFLIIPCTRKSTGFKYLIWTEN